MRLKEPLLASVIAAIATVLLTWPLAWRLSDGGRIDSGDGRFSVWNVAWVAHAITTNPFQVFDANIFYPHQNTLAYSEANLVAGVLATPIWMLTGNPFISSNWVIVCSFVLAALTTYRLMRHLTTNIPAAALTAFSFAFCPFVFSHIPHVQLLMTFVLPLALLAMHRFVEAPSGRRACWLGATTALAGLACGYYGIFAGLMTATGVIWFGAASGRWRDWRYWAMAALAGAVALAIVAPFFAPYAEMRENGFIRTLEDARLHSVRWRSYLASPISSHSWLLPLIGTWREVLFPGYLPILFAGISVVAVWRAPPGRSSAARRLVGFYALLAMLGFWTSLGPRGGLYTILHEMVPFFTMLRAPSRFGLIVTLALSVMAGLGLAALGPRLTRGRQRWVLLVVVAVVLARFTNDDLYVVPAPMASQAHRRLAALPWGAVAEFPYFSTSYDRHRHTEYMLMSTTHWKPLINGYSDYLPPDVGANVPRLATFPGPDAWRVLRETHTRYVIVHWQFYEDPTERARVAAGTRNLRMHLRPVVDAPDVSLYEIVSWPSDIN